MRCFLLLLALLALPALARQEPAPIKNAIESYLLIQSKGLPGKASFTIGNIDATNNLQPCASLDVAHAPGARPWGRTTVVVRCVVGANWQLFVPVQIRVVADYLVTTRSVAQGQTLSEADLTSQSGDLAELPTGTLTDINQAVGRVVGMPIPPGRPIRNDMLRQTLLVLQGQSVKVVSKGPGFEVANEGKALTNAADGQVVQVRLANGQIVSGIARAGGYVEISF